MTVEPREYHRTFLHWPRKAVMMQSDFAQMSRKVAEDQGKQTRSNAATTQTVGVRSGMETDTRKFHAALEISGSQFREVQIEEKSDQKFEQFATPWERKWSRLISHREAHRLSPVVDGNATVVGYCGIVPGNDMLIGRATGIALVYTAEETIKYHRMFVGNNKLHVGMDLSVYFHEFRYFTVLTDIYGEVTSFEFAYNSSNGEAHSTSFPILGWLKLLQSGLKILISFRNGFRTLGRQSPPAPAPRSLPPVKPASAPGGNVPRPGSQTVVTRQDSLPSVPLGGPRPRQQFETGLGEAITNVRRQLGLPPLPARTVSQLHAIARGRRSDNDFHAWLLANPNASWPDKFEMMNRIAKRWRVPGMPGDE